MKCCVDGCENDAFIKENGKCRIHHRRFVSYGRTERKNIYHGLKQTQEYTTWCMMKSRCYNENNPKYERYGRRGISICDRWNNSFLNFLNDIGKKPNSKSQIDRIDNDGNYTIENCRWVSPAENCQNKSTTKLTREDVIEIRSSNKTKKELVKKFGINKHHLNSIIARRSWSNI